MTKLLGVEDEVWKPVPRFENFYEVSNRGRAKSLARVVNYLHGTRVNKERILKLASWGHKGKQGYYHFGINAKGVNLYGCVHRLVAKLFIPNPLNLPCVNHKDSNTHNNDVANLEWCTQKHNVRHAMNSGRMVIHGEHSKNHVLTESLVKKCRKRASKGESIKSLSDELGISRSTLYSTISGNKWKYITENPYVKNLRLKKNREINKNLTYKGKTQPLVKWAREIGIEPGCLRARLTCYGWSIEDALTTPVLRK